MKKLLTLILSLTSTLMLYHPAVNATPLGDVKMAYVANSDGTFTYYFRVLNMGPPIAPNVTTPPNYQIFDWRTQQSYPAGGKFLNDDANLVVFGIDTKNDEVMVSNITNGFPSNFHGAAETGFTDSDNDGIPNKVIGWHLPFDFTFDQTLAPGKSIWFVSFKLDQEITDFEYWVGGSDDAYIWNDEHIMLEDSYGIYDATDETYMATFLTRSLKAKKISRRMLWRAF